VRIVFGEQSVDQPARPVGGPRVRAAQQLRRWRRWHWRRQWVDAWTPASIEV